MHRKWQEAATAAGGPDARIVVSKPEGKKLIYDLLFDAFRPMNINQIYKELKAVVPSPVLKACLDDMVDGHNSETSFDDSDDDEPKTKKAKVSNDKYAASLKFKSAKAANGGLYFFNYAKLPNGGNGLPPEEKHEFLGKAAESRNKVDKTEAAIKEIQTETTRLLGEPVNEDLTELLSKLEIEVKALNKSVEGARGLKANEKHKLQTKKRIESMTTFWRKRRRQCMEFLTTMEDMTEGTITRQKCLKGDGPIDIDSDEAVAKAAVEFAKKKGKDPSKFVAVTLDSQGVAQRVFVE